MADEWEQYAVGSSGVDEWDKYKVSDNQENPGSVLDQLKSDAPQLALTALNFIPGPIGAAFDALTSAAEHPVAFAFGGPSVNKAQEGANLAGLLKDLVTSDKSSLQSFLGDMSNRKEIFPSTGVTSAKTPIGSGVQLTANLLAPFASKATSSKDPLLMGRTDYSPSVNFPEVPKESQVSDAISGVESKSKEAVNFYKNSQKYGADVIDGFSAQKLADLEMKSALNETATANKAYSLAKKFRDEYYPSYSKSLSDDFGKAWDSVVKDVEVGGDDIMTALTDFGRNSGLYNKVTYTPESMSSVEKKIYKFIEGMRERVSSEGVNRMRLEDLSTGFEDILRSEYGKQWKNPTLDRFRKAFIDLAGDEKYSEMKAIKAEFKPKYQFREDMRKFFGRKKGEADMQSAVNLFKGFAAGDLQTKNPSHAEIIKKIAKQFGDGSLDSLSALGKERSDIESLKVAVSARAQADKNILTSKLLAKSANTIKDKNDKIELLNNLLGELQKRNHDGLAPKIGEYLLDKFLPGSKEVKFLKKVKGG